MEVGEKLQMLKDYIAVNQANMSQLFFSKKWQIPLREFIEIAYVIEADKHAENKRLKEETRWIPVSERLPENTNRVLILLNDGNVKWVATGYYSFGNWTVYDKQEAITHWKPIILPEQALKEK